jgi:hypothetical protein
MHLAFTLRSAIVGDLFFTENAWEQLRAGDLIKKDHGYECFAVDPVSGASMRVVQDYQRDIVSYICSKNNMHPKDTLKDITKLGEIFQNGGQWLEYKHETKTFTRRPLSELCNEVPSSENCLVEFNLGIKDQLSWDVYDRITHAPITC